MYECDGFNLLRFWLLKTVSYPRMYLFIFVNVPDGVWQFVHEASKENKKRNELRNRFKGDAVPVTEDFMFRQG